MPLRNNKIIKYNKKNPRTFCKKLSYFPITDIISNHSAHPSVPEKRNVFKISSQMWVIRMSKPAMTNFKNQSLRSNFYNSPD